MDEQQVEKALSRCEQALRSGKAPDLRGAGFWKAVGAVKRNPAWVERYADRIGTIDRAAFAAYQGTLYPMWLGTAVLAAATVAGLVLITIAYYVDQPWDSLLLLAGTGTLLGSTHSLAHVVVGRAAGIRFTDWFLNGPARIQPGAKTDYASYLRAAPQARARMHASGALVTKALPFLLLGAAWQAEVAWWAWAVMILVGVVQIITDIVFSTKQSDWKKYRREMRVAADLAGSASA